MGLFVCICKGKLSCVLGPILQVDLDWKELSLGR